MHHIAPNRDSHYKLFKYTLKSDLGTYFLYSFAVYIILLTAFISFRGTHQLTGAISLVILSFGIVFGALVHLCVNKIYEDALARDMNALYWSYISFFTIVAIPIYFVFRKRYPRKQKRINMHIEFSQLTMWIIAWISFALVITYALFYWIAYNN